jgi:hypothetical protein
LASYVKSTNFASKDTLPLGDPLKIVKGTEIDTEFNNIATAVGTKADLISPTFTGTPAAPTASPGTNTTQLATTAYVTAALQVVYPVGSVYINASVTTNPATLLGFGTWVEFGSGRVMVGQNTGDASFDVLEETGGSKDAIVVSHTHTGTTAVNGSHVHTLPGTFFQGGTGSGIGGGGNAINAAASTNAAGDHSHTFTTDSTGSSGTNANLQPYVVVKMWKRTA